MASGFVVEENDGDAGFSALGSWPLDITHQELHLLSTSFDNPIAVWFEDYLTPDVALANCMG